MRLTPGTPGNHGNPRRFRPAVCPHRPENQNERKPAPVGSRGRAAPLGGSTHTPGPTAGGRQGDPTVLGGTQRPVRQRSRRGAPPDPGFLRAGPPQTCARGPCALVPEGRRERACAGHAAPTLSHTPAAPPPAPVSVAPTVRNRVHSWTRRLHTTLPGLLTGFQETFSPEGDWVPLFCSQELPRGL